MALIAVVVGFLVGTARGYEVVFSDVQMDGMICGFGSQQNGIVVHPNDSAEKFPVIAFAHGFLDGGSTLDTTYVDLWTKIASQGYVIVAAKSANVEYCVHQYKDQLHALEWARSSDDVKDRIDFEAGAGIAGHSMGGRSTVLSSSQMDQLSALDVRAAVAEHPSVNVGGCPGCDPAVPILFIAGEVDHVVPPSAVLAQYQKVNTSIPRAFVEIKGADHHDPTYGQDLQAPYVVDWFNCFLKGNATACTTVQCNEPQATSPTARCEAKGMPVSTVTV